MFKVGGLDYRGKGKAASPATGRTLMRGPITDRQFLTWPGLALIPTNDQAFDSGHSLHHHENPPLDNLATTERTIRYGFSQGSERR